MLFGLSQYLSRPAVVPVRTQDVHRLDQAVEPRHPPVQPVPDSASQSWGRPKSREDEQTDIIMIDLD
jgi:hypothetical protein